MKKFVDRFGPWALVTGASSGIGEAFARRLAEIGLNLVLVALPEEKLKNVADDLQSEYSVSTRVVPVDLSRGDFLPVIKQATADLQVGLLVNNAGIATTGRFLDNDLAAELTMVHINSCAPLILAHHFGRLMVQRGRGGIIFLSSIAAYAAIPSMSNYAASKAHDLVFAEGLARELRQDGISILAVCPGPMRTNLWPAGSTLLLPMQPKVVVDIALKKLGRRTTVVAGWRNSVPAFATRLLPRSWNAAIFGSVIDWTLKGVKTPRQVQGANTHAAALIEGT
jgi:short-subunit dehydrogenase